jgi:hypothetical protein
MPPMKATRSRTANWSKMPSEASWQSSAPWLVSQ